jgi:predicted DNA-binding transcriptional regulator AlpA
MARTTNERDNGASAAPDDDDSIDTQEAARMLGLSSWGLAEIRRRGGGPPFFRVGRRVVRYRIGDVRAWIRSRTVGGAR